MRNLFLVALVAGWALLAPFYDAASGSALAAACGDGLIDSGEDCDDGDDNGSASTCCDATCQFKPDGNASCDGNVCTRPDTCLAGVCTPGTCADGASCTLCGGHCVDTGGSCDCDFAEPTPTPEACPAPGVRVGGGCWYFAPLATSCDQVCGGLGLAYDEATRTFAGSDGTYENCILVRDAINSAGEGTCDPLLGGDQNCTALGASSGIGCHCAPELGFLIALTRCVAPPTTSSAAVVNRARYCACQ
jgi:hypothetical protein